MHKGAKAASKFQRNFASMYFETLLMTAFVAGYLFRAGASLVLLQLRRAAVLLIISPLCRPFHEEADDVADFASDDKR